LEIVPSSLKVNVKPPSIPSAVISNNFCYDLEISVEFSLIFSFIKSVFLSKVVAIVSNDPITLAPMPSSIFSLAFSISSLRSSKSYPY
jgi:hypothetical protein